MSLVLNPVAFNLGPLQVKWYGILMATGVLVATLMAINEGKKRHIMPDDFIDFLLWAVPIGFIGARIYYVVLNGAIFSTSRPNNCYLEWWYCYLWWFDRWTNSVVDFLSSTNATAISNA